MGKTAKIIASLLLVILFLVLCLFVSITIFFLSWLRTYQAFTHKGLVAEFTITKVAAEGDLNKIKIDYTQVAQPSAFDTLMQGVTGGNSEKSTQESFELYGDQVLLGGPVVKFENLPTLLGFSTVYKVARVQGSYLDITKANRIPAGNIHDLNGGVDDTWAHFEEKTESYPWLIDTAYFSMAGISARSNPTKFGLYITEDGFLIDRID